MKLKKPSVLLTLLFVFSTSLLAADLPPVFVGSTPCGGVVREFLRIPNNTPCDKVQWRLHFADNPAGGSFRLSLIFGLQEPGGPGFVNGGKTLELQGKSELLHGSESRRYYTITAAEPARALSFLVINENLIHIVDSSRTLLVGNEFWSYTLNREGVGRDR